MVGVAGKVGVIKGLGVTKVGTAVAVATPSSVDGVAVSAAKSVDSGHPAPDGPGTSARAQDSAAISKVIAAIPIALRFRLCSGFKSALPFP